MIILNHYEQVHANSKALSFSTGILMKRLLSTAHVISEVHDKKSSSTMPLLKSTALIDIWQHVMRIIWYTKQLNVS